MNKKYLLSVLVENHPGILAKVAGLFSRRGFNIDSLAVGLSELPGLSRITIVVNGDEAMVDQVAKQLNKLIDVVSIEVLQPAKAVQRELVLIKVSCQPKNRSEIIQISEIFRAKIIDVSPASLTMEITGPSDKVDAFINMLVPFGIIKIARTGAIAVERN